jgi:hypothetical protein
MSPASFLAGGTCGYYSDGDGSAAGFGSSLGITVDGSGTIFVADTYSHRIRAVAPKGTVSTLAGNENGAFADETGTAAGFSSPTGIAVDARGRLFVADSGNSRIRMVNASTRAVVTLAGGGWGSADGMGTSASFKSPTGVAVDSAGAVIVADSNGHRIRKVAVGGLVHVPVALEVQRLTFEDAWGGLPAYTDLIFFDPTPGAPRDPRDYDAFVFYTNCENPALSGVATSANQLKFVLSGFAQWSSAVTEAATSGSTIIDISGDTTIAGIAAHVAAAWETAMAGGLISGNGTFVAAVGSTPAFVRLACVNDGGPPSPQGYLAAAVVDTAPRPSQSSSVKGRVGP